MRGKKKTEAYVPEELKYLGNCLLMARKSSNKNSIFYQLQLELDGLREAIQALPKNDRETVEKFCGLTGGLNHSRKLVNRDMKDLAYTKMCNEAIIPLRKLLTLEYVSMYDSAVKKQVNQVLSKVNMDGVEISDIECVKYLMAFFIYAQNGPKLGFEEDPMSIDNEIEGSFFFDEYKLLKQMSEEFSKHSDNSINFKLLLGFFEMIDFKDMLMIKKSMGIKIPKETFTEEFTIKDLEDIETAKTVSQIRELKERVFPCGAWDVVTALILGNTEKKITLEALIEDLNEIRKDWSKIAEFKTGERTLKTASELRTLNVYEIGGLEFTDIYEVMFIYLERNLIAIER